MLAPFLPIYGFQEKAPRQQWGLTPDPSEEAPTWEGGAVFFLKGREGAEGVDLSLSPGISHFSPPILLASANDVHFPLCTDLPN